MTGFFIAKLLAPSWRLYVLCIAVGVTQYDRITCCHMSIGMPNSVIFSVQLNMKQSGVFPAMRNVPLSY